MESDYVYIKINDNDNQLDQFIVRRKDEVFLRKILVMLESNHQ